MSFKRNNKIDKKNKKNKKNKGEKKKKKKNSLIMVNRVYNSRIALFRSNTIYRDYK